MRQSILSPPNSPRDWLPKDNGRTHGAVSSVYRKSAGSYIACPSLAVSIRSKLSFDRCEITDLTAMNRVPFFVKAHYTPEIYNSLKIHAQELPAPLYALDNDQALVIDGNKIELIGGGEEVIFGQK